MLTSGIHATVAKSNKSVPTSSHRREVSSYSIGDVPRPLRAHAPHYWRMGIGAGSDRQSVFRPAGTDGHPDQNSARPAIHWYKLNAGRPASRSIRGVGAYLGGPRSSEGEDRTKELHGRRATAHQW